MPQTRPNGIKTIIGSDPYNLTQDWAGTADSINHIIPVANLDARNALAPHEGMTIVRIDMRGILETYTNGAWVGAGSTDIATFGGTWTPLTSSQTPRVYRSGGIVFLIGGAKIGDGTGQFSNILTIPTAFRPSTTGTMFVGSGVSSTGVSYALALTNGVLSIPDGYRAGSPPVGSNFTVTSQWPLY